MKIKLYRKAPKCPKCKVPMKFESMTYTDEQEKKMDCEHDWVTKKKEAKTYGEGFFYDEYCPKCDETRFVDDSDRTIKSYTGFIHIPSAKLCRCPKCLDLYKVEDD